MWWPAVPGEGNCRCPGSEVRKGHLKRKPVWLNLGLERVGARGTREAGSSCAGVDFVVFGSFESRVDMEEGLDCVDALSACRTAFGVLAFLPGAPAAERCTTARALLFKVAQCIR